MSAKQKLSEPRIFVEVVRLLDPGPGVIVSRKQIDLAFWMNARHPEYLVVAAINDALAETSAPREIPAQEEGK